MSCPIKFNFEGYPSLKAVQAYYGANLTSLRRVINMISYIDEEGNRIPSSSFAKWYEDRYEENVDFKTENANTLKTRILKYYQLNLPSVTNNYRRENNTDNPVVIYGYESANARKDAKDSIISMIRRYRRRILPSLPKRRLRLHPSAISILAKSRIPCPICRRQSERCRLVT